MSKQEARHMANRTTLGPPTAVQDLGVDLMVGEVSNFEVPLEGKNATLLLTNKRVIRHSQSGFKTGSVSIMLENADSIELVRTQRNPQWVWVGLIFLTGGIALAASSPLFESSLLMVLMSLAVGPIGVVFILAYFGGSTAEVTVTAGQTEMECRAAAQRLDEMVELVRRFHDLKAGGHVDPHASTGRATDACPTCSS